jgi:hypothetical protein
VQKDDCRVVLQDQTETPDLFTPSSSQRRNAPYEVNVDDRELTTAAEDEEVDVDVDDSSDDVSDVEPDDNEPLDESSTLPQRADRHCVKEKKRGQRRRLFFSNSKPPKRKRENFLLLEAECSDDDDDDDEEDDTNVVDVDDIINNDEEQPDDDDDHQNLDLNRETLVDDRIHTYLSKNRDDIEAFAIKKVTSKMVVLEKLVVFLNLANDFSVLLDNETDEVLAGLSNFDKRGYAIRQVLKELQFTDLDRFVNFVATTQFVKTTTYCNEIIGQIRSYIFDDVDDFNIAIRLFTSLAKLDNINDLNVTAGLLTFERKILAATSSAKSKCTLTDWLIKTKCPTNEEEVVAAGSSPVKYVVRGDSTWDSEEWSISPPKNKTKSTKSPPQEEEPPPATTTIEPWGGEAEEMGALAKFREILDTYPLFKKWYQDSMLEAKNKIKMNLTSTAEAIKSMNFFQDPVSFKESVKYVIMEQPSWPVDAVRAGRQKIVKEVLHVITSYLARGPVEDSGVSPDITDMLSGDFCTQSSQESSDCPATDNEMEKNKACFPIGDEGTILLMSEGDTRWPLLMSSWRLATGTLFQPAPSLQSSFKWALLLLGGIENQFKWEELVPKFITFNDQLPRVGKNGIVCTSDISPVTIGTNTYTSVTYFAFTCVRAKPLLTIINELLHFLKIHDFDIAACGVLLPVGQDAFHSIYKDVDSIYKEFGGYFVGSIDTTLRKRLHLGEKLEDELNMNFKIIADYMETHDIHHKNEMATILHALAEKGNTGENDAVTKAARFLFQSSNSVRQTIINTLWFNDERNKTRPKFLSQNEGRIQFACADYMFRYLRERLGDPMLDPAQEWEWDEDKIDKFGEQIYRATLLQPQIWDSIFCDAGLNVVTDLIIVLKENKISPVRFLNDFYDVCVDSFRRNRCWVFTGERVCGKSVVADAIMQICGGDRMAIDTSGGRDFKVDHFTTQTHGLVLLEDVQPTTMMQYIDKKLRSYIDGDQITTNPKMGQIKTGAIWPPQIITTNWQLDSDSDEESNTHDKEKRLPMRNMKASGFLQHRYKPLKFRTPLYTSAYHIDKLCADDVAKVIWRYAFLPACNAIYGGPQCLFSPCQGRTFDNHSPLCRFMTEIVTNVELEILPGCYSRMEAGDTKRVYEGFERLDSRHLGRSFNLNNIKDVRQAFFWKYKIFKTGSEEVRDDKQELKRIIDQYCDKVLEPVYWLSHVMRGDLSQKRNCRWASKHVFSRPQFRVFDQTARDTYGIFTRQNMSNEIMSRTIIETIRSFETLGGYRDAILIHYGESHRAKVLTLRDANGPVYADNEELTLEMIHKLRDVFLLQSNAEREKLLEYYRKYISKSSTKKRWTRLASRERFATLLLANIDLTLTLPELRTYTEGGAPTKEWRDECAQICKDQKKAFDVFFETFAGLTRLRFSNLKAAEKPTFLQRVDYYA